MLYALLLLIALLLIGYFTGRWLLAEMREARGFLGARLKVLGGGLTSDALLARVRQAVHAEGLRPDCIVLVNAVTATYDALRGAILRRPADAPLPGAVVLALAVDVDAGRLWLRAVDAPRSGETGHEWSTSRALGDCTAIERVANPLPGGLSPPGDEALALRFADDPDRPAYLVLEPAWGVAPRDLADRVDAMVFGGHKPAGSPVLVR